MKKRLIAIGMLLALLLTASGCESDLERAERKYEEARQEAVEARQKAVEAQERVDLLEAILGK